MISIGGEMVEVGDLESGHGRGVVMKYEDRFIEVTGLTVEECKIIGKLLYKPTTITISTDTLSEQT